MDRDASFGRLLRRLRKARDLTQAALAQQIYCAPDTIKKLEQGLRRPSRQLAAQLADGLDLEGAERAAFLAAARAVLSIDHLPQPSQQIDLGLVHAPESAEDAPDQLGVGSIARMRLLGGFSLEYRAAPLTMTSPRMQALLAYLALHPTEPQPRQRLAFLLWPDSSESQAHTNLRTLLHRLQIVLPNTDHLIRIDAQAIAWHPAVALSLDVADFEEALRQATAAIHIGDDAAACAALERAAACYAGELLPDYYDEWVVSERERLAQLLLAGLERLAGLLEQRHAYTAAITHARRLVQLDPLNEAAYLTLMRLHVASGDRAAALRAYYTCVTTLQAELGAAPGAALHAAYERLLAAEDPHISAPPTAPDAAAPLVGRQREWKRMQAIWQTAATAQPRMLILTGEAGIGKTRLAEEFLRWASRQGALTAIAHCYAAEGELAYAPITAWLRSDALQPGLARLEVEWLSQVARLVPELLVAQPDLRRPDPLTQQWQRQRLFESLARAILASGRPLLLLVDDLQWCDRDTLEWLHFLLRFDSHARLFVVGTVRIEEVSTDHPLVDLLDALRRESRVAEIDLHLLSQEETLDLARHLAGRTLSREQAARLYIETEGNPLFVIETVRAELLAATEHAVQEVGQDATAVPAAGAAHLPPGVQAVVARRLGQVAPAARELLGVAAVIGRSFTFGVLARAAAADEDTLVRGLDELWQRRIVREHGPDGYDFTHDKLRVVAYAGLSTARRRVLHRRVAEALEAEHAVDLNAISGQVALHYERAGRAAQAVSYYQRAATAARQLYANAEAIANYRRALALLSGEPQHEHVELYDELGDMLHHVGRYEEARAAWQGALDATPAHNRIACAHLYRKLGNAWRDQYHYDEALRAYAAAEVALGIGVDETDQAVESCWVEIELERITTQYWLGQAPEMLQLIDQIRPIVERHGSAGQQARLHQISWVALIRRDRYRVSPETLVHARAYRAAVEAANDAAALPAARFQLGFALLWADDLTAAEEEIHAALVLAEHRGDISLEGRCLTYLTVIARKRGQVDHVRTYAERSLRVATTGQMPDYIGAAHGNLAWLAWRAGDLAAVRKHSRQALEAWHHLPAGYMFEWIGRWPAIGVALAEGDVVAVTTHVRALLDERQQRPPPPLEQALESAVRAAHAGDLAAINASLAAVTEAARAEGYL